MATTGSTERVTATHAVPGDPIPAANRPPVQAAAPGVPNGSVKGGGGAAGRPGGSPAVPTAPVTPVAIRYRASSVARSLAAVRGFHRFLVRERLAGSDPSHDLGTPKVPSSLP